MRHVVQDAAPLTIHEAQLMWDMLCQETRVDGDRAVVRAFNINGDYLYVEAIS